MLRRLIQRVLGTGLLLALGAVPCSAGVIAVAPAPNAAAAERDLGLTIQVRRLLLRDPELGPLNIGVRIRNRVATLWGPVASAELSFKAEVCLRQLLELVEVRNELFVTGESVQERAPILPLPPAFLPPAAPPGLPALPAAVAPPLAASPAAPVLVAPPPGLDEIELPPKRLPQPK